MAVSCSRLIYYPLNSLESAQDSHKKEQEWFWPELEASFLWDSLYGLGDERQRLVGPEYCIHPCTTVFGLLSLLDCSLPGFSVYGILQASILEWVAISFSRRSSRPRDWTHTSEVSCLAGRFFTSELFSHSDHMNWGRVRGVSPHENKGTYTRRKWVWTWQKKEQKFTLLPTPCLHPATSSNSCRIWILFL